MGTTQSVDDALDSTQDRRGQALMLMYWLIFSMIDPSLETSDTSPQASLSSDLQWMLNSAQKRICIPKKFCLHWLMHETDPLFTLCYCVLAVALTLHCCSHQAYRVHVDVLQQHDFVQVFCASTWG